MMYGMHKMTIYLPDDLKAELARMVEETGRSEADLIHEGIRLALTQHLPPTPHTGAFDSGDTHLSERVGDMMHGLGTR
jgi:anti-sigma factor ChrR (cupin superfamily)